MIPLDGVAVVAFFSFTFGVLLGMYLAVRFKMRM